MSTKWICQVSMVLVLHSMSNPFEERWDDAIPALKDPLEVPVGLVTRLRAKRFKKAFNGLLQDIWALQRIDLSLL